MNFKTANNSGKPKDFLWKANLKKSNGRTYIGILNYKLNQRSIQYKEYFLKANYKCQIFNSCDSFHDEIHSANNIVNLGYTALWNELIKDFLESQCDYLMIITSDVTIKTSELFDRIHDSCCELFEDEDVLVYNCDVNYSFWDFKDKSLLEKYKEGVYEIPMYDGMFVVYKKELIESIGTIPLYVNSVGWVQETTGAMICQKSNKKILKDYRYVIDHPPSRGYCHEEAQIQEDNYRKYYNISNYFKFKENIVNTYKKLLPSKKILFINHSESRTGAPKVLKNIIDGFIKNNKDFYQTYVLSLNPRDDKETWDEYNSIRLENIDRNTMHEKIAFLVHSLNIEIIYANSFETLELAYYAKVFNPKIKTVLHIHELNEMCNMFKKYILPRVNYVMPEVTLELMIHKMDKIITICDAATDLMKSFEIPESKILRSRPAIDADQIQIKITEPALEINADKLVVTVGDAIHRKGFERFVEVARALPEYSFLWVGWHQFKNGKIYLPQWRECQETCVELPDNVMMLHNQLNPYPIMKKADLSLILSKEDPLPCSLIEMKYLGVPCIAVRDSGDCHKIMDDNDVLLERYTVEDAVAAVKTLIGKRRAIDESLYDKWNFHAIYTDIENLILSLK